jgi:Zn finger protein HypA/HybF involved in hydrogenase expression
LQLWGFRCERCSHEWVPREKEQEPRVCPKCKSPYWNVPRRKPKRR